MPKSPVKCSEVFWGLFPSSHFHPYLPIVCIPIKLDRSHSTDTLCPSPHHTPNRVCLHPQTSFHVSNFHMSKSHFRNFTRELRCFSMNTCKFPCSQKCSLTPLNYHWIWLFLELKSHPYWVYPVVPNKLVSWGLSEPHGLYVRSVNMYLFNEYNDNYFGNQ